MDANNPNDAWQMQANEAVWRFGETLKRLHGANPWPHLPLLEQAIPYLMIELWDHGFSQTDIRKAFEAAIAQMPAYAAGEERRS